MLTSFLINNELLICVFILHFSSSHKRENRDFLIKYFKFFSLEKKNEVAFKPLKESPARIETAVLHFTF